MDDRNEKLDELASDLDDLKTTVEELADEPPQGAKPNDFKKLERALDNARDITDDLADQ